LVTKVLVAQNRYRRDFAANRFLQTQLSDLVVGMPVKTVIPTKKITSRLLF